MKCRLVTRCCLAVLLFFPVFPTGSNASETTTIVRLPLELRSFGERGLLPFPRPQRRGVSLALSGGGSRGVAHLGVLRALEEHDIPIDGIAGTSGGGLFGALYALGYDSSDLSYLFGQLQQDKLFFDAPQRNELALARKVDLPRSVVGFRFQGWIPQLIPESLTAGQHVQGVITELVMRSPWSLEQDFDKLRVRLRLVATNWKTGEEIVFRSGTLNQAIMASIAMPLVFTPVQVDAMTLTDGGLVNTLPSDIARTMTDGLVIAVDITAPIDTTKRATLPWNQVFHMVSILQRSKIEESKAESDIIIMPRTPPTATLDFSADFEAIEQAGYEATLGWIDSIQTLLDADTEGGAPFLPADVAIRCDGGEVDPAHRALLQVRARQRTTIAGIRADLRRLYGTGWYADVRAALTQRAAAGVAVTFEATLNPVIQDVQLHGNASLSAASLLPMLETQPGTRYNHWAGARDHRRIIEAYRNLGLSLARIDTCRFDPATRTLHIDIDEGRVAGVRVRAIPESVPLFTKDFVVLREFPVQAGDLFRIEQATRGISNLHGTQLFRRSYYTVQQQAGGPLVTLHVEEQDNSILEFGGVFDNLRNGAGHLRIRRENLFGSGAAATVFGLYGARDKALESRLQTHRVFSSYFNYAVRFRYDDTVNYARLNNGFTGEYDLYRWSAHVAIGRQISRSSVLSAEWSADKVTVHHPELDEALRLRRMMVRWLVDTRNRMPYPSSGYFHHMWYERAGQVMGGNTSYSKFFSRIELYKTFRNIHTFHPKLITGMADQTLPYAEWFRIGGARTLYGWNDRILHGRALFAGSAEYRIKLPIVPVFTSYLSFRYDLGAVYRETEHPRMRDMQHAYGGGLAVELPVGPLAIDWGRTDGSFIAGKQDRFYFSLGYALDE